MALIHTPQMIATPHFHPMLYAPPPAPLPEEFADAFYHGLLLDEQGLYLGADADSDEVCLLKDHLATHLHIIGATGTGKTRLLFWLFQLLCHTKRPIVLIDPKGGLYELARNFAMLNGFKKRLVLFDLTLPVVPGYNPLRENGLRIDLQAQYCREAVKSAWGASSFDATPLLARMLYLCLYVARAMRVDMLAALDVLRPAPTLRQQALQQISDPFVRNSLVAFDQLSDRLKSEQASSTISRLEAFLCDETVRKVICSPQSLDLEALLLQRKIILLRFSRYQPLLPDTLKLLGRMFFNDLLAHIYKGHGEGRFDENHPCYVLCDEVQNFATKQVCDALDEGRGIGCHTILAHQHLDQLSQEDQSGYLRKSVMTDARTKILFGGLNDEDQEEFANILFKRHYDPLAVKYVQKTPIFAPVKTVIEVPTYSRTEGVTTSVAENFGEADNIGHSIQQSRSQGRSDASSVAHTHGEQESHTNGTSLSTTNSHNWGSAATVSHARTRSEADTTGTADTWGQQQGTSRSRGTTDTVGQNATAGWSDGTSTTDASGRSSAVGSSQSAGTNVVSSTGEGEVLLPQEERVFSVGQDDPVVVSTSTHTGSAEGRSQSAGNNRTDGTTSAHADSRQHQTSGSAGSSSSHAQSTVVSDTNSSSNAHSLSHAHTTGLSETEGWASSTNEGFGRAEQTGTSEAHTLGTNRSTTLGDTVTNSLQISEGSTDSVGHTTSHGVALSEGKTHTRGMSVTKTPFYDYVREEIESPVFLTPEEQKILFMQWLSKIPNQHAELIAPVRGDCFFRTPYVPAPEITPRRLAAEHEYVYRTVPGYPRVAPKQDDIIDVEAREVTELQRIALPSPTEDAEAEASLWERVRAISYGERQEKS